MGPGLAGEGIDRPLLAAELRWGREGEVKGDERLERVRKRERT